MPSKCTFDQDEIREIRAGMIREKQLEQMEKRLPKYTLITAKGLLRNNSPGDYYETPDGDWNIIASELRNIHHSELILTHEFIEVILVRAAGIPEPVIDAWDAYFEILRQYGLVGPDDEPGDDPRSPYYEQHQLATKVEKIVCEEGFKLDWDKYDEACIELIKKGTSPK